MTFRLINKPRLQVWSWLEFGSGAAIVAGLCVQLLPW